METFLSILLGIGLSAATGFRIFIPFLILSIASISGYVSLSENFEWIGTVPSLIAFGSASILEVAAYYIPWLDNLLDSIASPTAVIAGSIIAASSIIGMDPLLKWTLAIIAGGGAAGFFQTLTGTTRISSSVTTAGFGNHIVSSLEAIISVIISVLSIFLPIAAAAIIIFSIIYLWKKVISRFFRKNEST